MTPLETRRARRSVLYVPASHARAMEKARSLPVDGVILDLEDAVAPEMKVEARARAVDAASQGHFSRMELVIRINALDSPWGGDDLDAVARCAPDAVLLPKVSCADDVLRAARVLDRHQPRIGTALWAMLETSRGLLESARIAEVSRRKGGERLRCLVMGLNDLARETGVRFNPGRASMVSWLTHAVLVARANGLAVIDGVFNALGAPDALRIECEQARDLGFDGKTLIHPEQVDVANQAFTPSSAEVAHARAVVAAFADPRNAGLGALRVDGQLAERLHLEVAHRVLAMAGCAVG